MRSMRNTAGRRGPKCNNTKLFCPLPEVHSTLRILITIYFPHHRTALKYVEKKDELRHACQKREAAGKKGPEEKGSNSILESFFESGLETKDIVGLVVDILMAGIDTVQYINLILCHSN